MAAVPGGGVTRSRRVVVMGFRAVGKSSLCSQFAESTFDEAYHPTIESTYRATLTHDARPVTLEVLDTAGQDEHSIFDERYTVGMHGYVLVYSIDSRHAFDIVSVINDKILNALGADTAPRILIANKVDLPAEQRRVSAADGAALAARWGVPYVECSAKNNRNVREAFQQLLVEVERSYMPPPAPTAAKATSDCVLL